MNGESSNWGKTAPCCVCGRCHRQWVVWHDFLVDPEVQLLGLQLVQSMPDRNLLVFDHICGTSISVLVNQLRPFVPGSEGAADAGSSELVSSEECTRLCLDLEHLVACDRPCPRARDRQLAQAIIDLRQGAE